MADGHPAAAEAQLARQGGSAVAESSARIWPALLHLCCEHGDATTADQPSAKRSMTTVLLCAAKLGGLEPQLATQCLETETAFK